ncbi:hypothetical protein M427DRAFT_151744 [Gonapodya prolifera JEL478]|uniref:Trichohyalin-plectin-homology domain-containing protein n=1 Tax=Gonapodya prolifera (strain JEL478) TaxID=1344416 RepID=A0A139AUE4_GONPJ|nr:hypothetical protein M427DRAFT_151744 [Gonapodya prolifera JEL478]|eukprot:KXS20351.1 hypothetical protein M427DRAFT_151744 [Gonapodya prolifera JEL478]
MTNPLFHLRTLQRRVRAARDAHAMATLTKWTASGKQHSGTTKRRSARQMYQDDLEEPTSCAEEYWSQRSLKNLSERILQALPGGPAHGIPRAVERQACMVERKLAQEAIRRSHTAQWESRVGEIRSRSSLSNQHARARRANEIERDERTKVASATTALARQAVLLQRERYRAIVRLTHEAKELEQETRRKEKNRREQEEMLVHRLFSAQVSNARRQRIEQEREERHRKKADDLERQRKREGILARQRGIENATQEQRQRLQEEEKIAVKAQAEALRSLVRDHRNAVRRDLAKTRNKMAMDASATMFWREMDAQRV